VPGVDYAPPRIDGKYTLLDCFVDYTREHCVPTGGDAKRAWIAFRAWIDSLGLNRECITLTRADGRTVVERELARGVSSATARKHLTMGLAAFNHARKEERLGKDKVLPAFQMPAAAQPRLRWLTREEHRKLMLLPKPGPRQLFWLLAFGTGARTGAILDLEWSRVDLVRRTIDYRREGVVYKNKRRAVVFINDSLLPRLETAYARRDPSCPFVVNRKGKRYSQGSLLPRVQTGSGVDWHQGARCRASRCASHGSNLDAAW
jgi:integrase